MASMDKERMIKVYICVVAGLLISRLLGAPTSLTVCVSALLVAYNNSSGSWRGTATYIRKRLLTQVVVGVIAYVTYFASGFFLKGTGDRFLATVAIALIPTLIIEYRFKIGSMYILTPLLAAMVFTTGYMGAGYLYYVQRLLYIAVGCSLGALIAWIYPSKRYTFAQQRLKGSIEKMLTLSQDLMGEEVQKKLPPAVAASNAEAAGLKAELSLLKADMTLRKKAAKTQEIDLMLRQLACLEALTLFGSFSSGKTSLLPKIQGEFRRACLEMLAAVVAVHGKLYRYQFYAEAAGTVYLPALLPDAGTEEELAFLGVLIIYKNAVRALLGILPDAETGDDMALLGARADVAGEDAG